MYSDEMAEAMQVKVTPLLSALFPEGSRLERRRHSRLATSAGRAATIGARRWQSFKTGGSSKRSKMEW